MLRGAWQLTRSLLTLPAYRRELQQRAATDRTLDQHMATAFETGHGMLYIRPYQVPMEIRALLERLTADRTSLSLFTADEIYAIAAKGGAVIRGWGATHLLRPVAHVLRVRVCAPLEHRLEGRAVRKAVAGRRASRAVAHRRRGRTAKDQPELPQPNRLVHQRAKAGQHQNACQ